MEGWLLQEVGLACLSKAARANRAHLLDDGLHVLACERVVQSAGAQDVEATQERRVHKSVPTDLSLFPDLCVQFIEALSLTSQVLGRGTAAHDGECHRHYPLQIRCGMDEGGQLPAR